MKIGLPVLEKKIFEGFYHGGHLGHVTRIMLTNFISLYLKAFIQNLVQNGPVVSEKIWFEFLYVPGAIQRFVDKLNNVRGAIQSFVDKLNILFIYYQI